MDGAVVIVLVCFLMVILLTGLGVGIYFLVKSKKKKDKCTPGSTKDYDFKRREWSGTSWECPQGWEQTTCDWKDGKDLGERQCRILKTMNTMSPTPPASALSEPVVTRPVLTTDQQLSAPVTSGPQTIIQTPTTTKKQKTKTKTKTKTKKKGKKKTKNRSSAASIQDTNTNVTGEEASGEWQKTNITYYGQSAADDNGEGFVGVNLFKLGNSGLQFNGKKVYPVAVHHDHAPTHLYKVLEVRGDKVTPGFLGFVADICDRSDSSCSNAYKNGFKFLVDIHKTGFEASGNKNNGQDFTTGEFKVIGQISPTKIPKAAWLKGDKTYVMCKCTGKCEGNAQIWKSVKELSSC